MAGVFVDVRRASWQPGLGISRYSRSLVREMLAYPHPDIELILIDLKSSDWPADIVARVRGGSNFVQRAYQEQIEMLMLSRRADLLHLPWYEGPAVPACPLVMNIHDLDTFENKRFYSWRFRAYYNSLLRVQARRATHVIVPSQATLRSVERVWPTARIAIIPNGVDEIFFDREPNGHDPSWPPTILYTGGYGYRKRVEDLLQAFDVISVRDRDVRLVLTGRAPERIRRLVALRKSSPRIEITGFLSDSKLSKLYQAATVLAYPSMLEGFGFPVLEAFASGTPVVAARSGSIPEIAEGAAELVEPCRPEQLADALLQLLANDRLARELGARGRQRAAGFQWSRTARLTLELYRAVL
jgi:glycosyltransferase involved in cell wall biosynthesis